MKVQIKQVFRSPKFLLGFVLINMILLVMIIYPLYNRSNPLAILGLGTFFPPGTYVSTYDVLEAQRQYTLRMPGAAENRVYARLHQEDRERMKDWLILYGIPEDEIDIYDSEALLTTWWTYYDSDIRFEGMIRADHLAFVRIDRRLEDLFNSEDFQVYRYNPETGEDVFFGTFTDTDYVNLRQVTNVVWLPLGTDNFGADVMLKLVHAIRVSLYMGLLAGVIATIIGLALGLISGYVGGLLDEIIMFILNMFSVIPGIVLLILISYSIGQEQRGATTVAVVIGLTAWVWTARSVRAQVISLRNRDHVNLSKLSGHSIFRIVMKDILPYIASYVVMAFILQVSSAILAEAGLSMLGLGPRTTDVPTLGLMMNWAMRYTAHLQGAWWAFFPVVVVIATISFALNLMNTGLDQVFNPQLRD